MNTSLNWTDLDDRAVDTARVLAADAVEKVGNGHPGTAISLAPVAHLLYQHVMSIDPTDPQWLGRDRFLMSAGHSSLTQYNQLFLTGAGLELEDIQSLRTWGSKTPGHPEYHHTKGVECTTGPLGAGISNAVGMAMAVRRQRGLFDPDAAPGESPFDHDVYCIAGDGCMQEGVASEASSLAGTQQLGNLVLIYDDNRISIEGETKIAFTEDVDKRYESYGWHVQHVDWTNGGSEYKEDVPALLAALDEAKSVTDKPSFIRLTTVIGWPLPTLAGTHKVHGNKLGAEEVAGLKKVIGFDPERTFQVDDDVLDYTRGHAAERGKALREAWNEKFEAWASANPEGKKLLDRVSSRELPEGIDEALSEPFADEKMATRAASGKVLEKLAGLMPELWGGSADLAGSNNTTMKGEPSFFPPSQSSEEFTGDWYGRTLHFGVREHAMGGVVNGITLEGLTRCYGGTFFVFSDYMRPAVRLSAIMEIPSIFVWTHDSVGVGEDGPTHQPIEQLAACRAIPGLDIVRPADANETQAAWLQILKRTNNPAGLLLSRQDLPIVKRGEGGYAGVEGVAKGAYVLSEADGDAQVILIGTGSEVQHCLSAQQTLQSEGIPTRVVSMPCQEWFEEQDEAYKQSILPDAVTARVSVEAAVAMGWSKFVGPNGRSVSIEHFGASASGDRCMKEFGMTPERVVEEAKLSLQGKGTAPRPSEQADEGPR